jgi:8-oxo-dGTP pyrophosphatase MutT (NUDIX family)
MEPLPSKAPSGLQVIPRPPAHRPGGPAPWAGLEPAARRSISLERVRAAVAAAAVAGVEGAGVEGAGVEGDHPAGTAQPMVEFIRSVEGVDVAARPAAVLVALFEEDGETRVLLTVRSSRLRSHRGEVAFPGGRLDPGESSDEAARREAFEEVRLDPSEVTIVGHLSALPTVSSNTLMTPVVATLPGRPTTLAAPDEVSRVFDVSLAELLDERVFHEEWWAVPGRPGADGSPGTEFPVWFFNAGGENIWGATARVLTELICVVLGVAIPRSLWAG